MADAWDLGWKLAAVLRGAARPELLHPYTDERQAAAQEPIDFDREFARMFSAPPKESAEADGEGVDPEEFQRYFVQQGRFTACAATRYTPSMITGEPAHQHLAEGFPTRASGCAWQGACHPMGYGAGHPSSPQQRDREMAVQQEVVISRSLQRPTTTAAGKDGSKMASAAHCRRHQLVYSFQPGTSSGFLGGFPM